MCFYFLLGKAIYLMKNSVIVSAVRTPIGSFNGGLSHIPAPRLGAEVILETLKRAHVQPSEVSEVYMGCVLTAGVGQAPARQAAIFAELPNSTPCTTVGKVCGSGLKAIILGAQAIQCSDTDIVVSGGMENMSLAPHLLEKSRQGYRLGNTQLIDSMIKDGLWDVYNKFHMGSAGEMCAKKYNFSRKEQDEYAIQSYTRAQRAQKKGYFKSEIFPLDVADSKGKTTTIDKDEEPFKLSLEKVSKLTPVFERNGTITAANSSKISDGASAVLLMSEEEAKKRKLIPLAKIIAYTSYAQEPEWFTTAPQKAIQKVLKKVNLSVKDIDLFEINEAFSVVAMSAIQDLSLDPKKVNVHGGAVALGHPIGASGTRILTTLMYAMKRYKVQRGIAAICIGGGESLAIIIERP